MKIGLEVLLESPGMADRWGKFLLLANQASVLRQRYSWEWIYDKFPKQLSGFLAPQHGFHATLQDNMIESEDSVEPYSGLPIYSLYSRTREPTPPMLKGIDTIVIDIQIVGCRVYTFKYTVAACLRAAKKHGLSVVVLDRPNPLGRKYEGRILENDCKSFVGEFEIPMRHGLSVGAGSA